MYNVYKLYIHTYKQIYTYVTYTNMYIYIFKFYYILLPGVSLLRYKKGEYNYDYVLLVYYIQV